MAVLTQFFCKMYFLYASRSRKIFFDNFFGVLPPETASFFGEGSLTSQISRIGVLLAENPISGKVPHSIYNRLIINYDVST